MNVAARLQSLAAPGAIYPAFATHNAYTIGAIKALAGPVAHFEFQRLHGMGDEVYEELAKIEGNRRTPVRIYAPVGGHKVERPRQFAAVPVVTHSARTSRSNNALNAPSSRCDHASPS